MNFSIIIFCFNEEKTIAQVFKSAVDFALKKSTDYEIIIVNDGSTDNTNSICLKLKSENPDLKLITHPKNQGIGMALRSGYLSATKDYVCAVPGDGQFDFNELNWVLPFDKSRYYSFYRTHTGYNFYRAFLTRLNRLFNQHFLGIYLRDVNWVKVYRKEHLAVVNPVLKSSLIESEICAKLFKENILPIEIPSNYLPRKGGIAKGGNWHTLKLAIAEVFLLWIEIINYRKRNF